MPSAPSLAPGLYLVATPIGAARDITLRALDILASADMLAAEDTRNTRHLMEIHGIALNGRKILPYHDHNGAQQRPRLLAAVAEGRSLAYVSDAGTPMVADPGYALAQGMIAQGLPVFAAPGASALLAALAVAGQPTDRFMFAGFPPPKAAARARFLADLAAVPATLVFYESPRRLADCLAGMATAYGDARPASVCRELTKKFEQVRRGALGTLAAEYAAEPAPRGEVVIVLGPPVAIQRSAETLDSALTSALANHSLKDAVAAVAEALDLPRKQVYARALDLAK
ncbi:16S rRNA (cytidine(1402)-2'-O)-methyltransferase [Abyssibius alkaniclasticus]|uniref:16S rRNA (cytidine(1402)-2'-O)-methyltransferase n=1 Tax=Abyssibius alkaniclasticus TaxID=2881234 RepID=UPI0040587ACC|tara:strand:+ start:756 stop:1610 length:855 start_codon:yes stop_codon:yes gene_type:complete